MRRALIAILLGAATLTASAVTALPVAAQTAPVDAPPLRISVSPSVITAGQASTVCVRTVPDERVNLYAYTLPSQTYVLVRSGSAASALPCWAVRPGADTRLYAAPAEGPVSRNSPTIVIQVRRTGSTPAPRPTPAPSSGTYSAPLRNAVRALTVAAENNAGYSRVAQFGNFIDADRDCQNTRHEVLIAESRIPPTYTSRRCTVTAGRWTSFYDNQTYSSASQVQIDHLVPVAEAWGSGARTWTQQRRVAFYNDLGVAYALNAMQSRLNQSKQASGPEQWMPPANQCRYIEVWTAMKVRWRLSVDPAERAALVQYADSCPNSPVTVRRA